MTQTTGHEAPLDGVAHTALWTADMRARESARPDPLCVDPWAARFVEAGGPPPEFPANELMRRVLPDWLAVRTRFFDDHLLAAARSGCRQVVILAAGLDTRSLRLDWPEGTRVYEVDLPALHAFKERALKEAPETAGALRNASNRIPVPADLSGSWETALTDAGLDPGQPTAWLCEGAMFYFSEAQTEHIVATLTRLSAPGSTLGVDCLNAERGESAFMHNWLGALAANGTPWLWQIADPERWWAERGWDALPVDLFSLPYLVQRFAAYPQLSDSSESEAMLLITGERSVGGRTATRST
ncbi:SAM-dependent methyltransferase [Streptomyces blattellae]|uniref:SAM-dependent methyltransferase n=1 Tax=Streptomyces blattellae TaxID=2569855 RepID=UPI0012B7AEA7|nr:SAM-dependent methyltransferase [Streptomyces blattellae]